MGGIRGKTVTFWRSGEGEGMASWGQGRVGGGEHLIDGWGKEGEGMRFPPDEKQTK